MDEPFGALDAITREQMGLELLKIWSIEKVTTMFVTHDIAESVFLSDRVIALSKRPGRVVKEVRIDLPRPRKFEMRGSKEFAEYTLIIREALGLL
jgi:NitT/TauT family transport system ATP-binding protein